MTLLIDNRPAVIQADTAFDYIAKNSLFDNKDDYTLEITLPLKDCLTNCRIFGIRETVPEQFPDLFEARIIEGGFRKTGALRVLSVTRDEVKAQFIEQALGAVGQQEWENTLLCDLDFGSVTPDCMVPFYDSRTGQAVAEGHGEFLLRSVAVYAARAMGYTLDDSRLDNSYMWHHLLVCNPVTPHNETVGGATVEVWPLRDAMPEWTVGKFFGDIESLLAVRVLVDAETAAIRMVPLSDFYNTGETIEVTPSDEYEAETLDEEDTAYWKDSNLKYRDPGKFGDCRWFIDRMEREGGVTDEPSLAAFLQRLEGWRTAEMGYQALQDNMDCFIHLHRVGDRHFILSAAQYGHLPSYQNMPSGGLVRLHRVEPLDRFRPTGGDGGDVEIGFKPAVLIGNPAVQDAGAAERIPYLATPAPTDSFDGMPHNSQTLQLDILKEEKTDAERFDTIHIALYHESGGKSMLWTHDIYNPRHEYDDSLKGNFITANVNPTIIDEWERQNYPVDYVIQYTCDLKTVRDQFYNLFGTRLPSPLPCLCLYPFPELDDMNDSTDDLSPASIRAALPYFDRTRKYTFRFLYRGMPDPKAVYLIRGKRYLCRQLTAQVTADGISDLKKGEFYRMDGGGQRSFLA